MTNSDAVLVLEDGRIFRGEAFGALGSALGEAVFTTGMTGYQETLTDPSYHRQIVVQTAPQIGNTGWNEQDDESARIQVAGYAVRDPSRSASNWRATRELPDVLAEQGIVGIAGIDTRALVRHLRERGAMRAGVFSGPALGADPELVRQVRSSPPMAGADLYGAVTTRRPYVVPANGMKRFTVAALDVGIKFNTPRMMAMRGIETHVLPADTTIEEIEALNPDGFFLSNGPGDPATADGPVALTREVLARRIPLFGICFGNQILARALGRGTYKLRYGHRGINIPVVEHATGRVSITSQNHGFAVVGEAGERFDTPFGTAEITHTCPNDGCVEGLAALDVPAFSVQYHPEAAAGPHDAANLFDRFVALMVQGTSVGLPKPPPGEGRHALRIDHSAPVALPAPEDGVAADGVAVDEVAADEPAAGEPADDGAPGAEVAVDEVVVDGIVDGVAAADTGVEEVVVEVDEAPEVEEIAVDEAVAQEYVAQEYWAEEIGDDEIGTAEAGAPEPDADDAVPAEAVSDEAVPEEAVPEDAVPEEAVFDEAAEDEDAAEPAVDAAAEEGSEVFTGPADGEVTTDDVLSEPPPVEVDLFRVEPDVTTVIPVIPADDAEDGRAAQDSAAQDSAAQDSAAQDSAAQEWAERARAAQERAARESAAGVDADHGRGV